MNDTRPIGLFDSGIGGTSIWHAVHKLLPYENTIFIGDSANAPYGQKTKDEIISLSKKNIDWLLQRDAKLIIVACNTATMNAVEELRASYKIPIIGIEPAIKPAALNSITKKVGVLATKGTITSKKYSESKTNYPNITFIDQIGYRIVQLIEDGHLHSEELEILLKQYIDPMLQQHIDYLVLGCTHYPYLIPILKKLIPESVKIIDSGEAVAKQTYKILNELQLLKTDQLLGSSQFYTNKDVEILQSFIGKYGTAQKIDF